MGMSDQKKLYGTATIGSKGQVVIPAEAREEFNLNPGDKMYVVGATHGSGLVFIKEDALEAMVEQLSAQIEGFRDFKEKTTKKNNK